MRIPVISLPLKEGQELDFTEALSNYISMVYEQDPANFQQDIRELNETRSKITNQELNNQQQREAIIKYYFLLESVEKRFQFDEEHCKLEFVWKDSFCGARVSQNSVAFEKACILFNLAVLSSRLGSMQDRFELSGLKLAFNYFQSASGLFKHIRHTFINPPSQDLQSEFVVFLEELMLTQAQELLVEKSRDENKSDQLVARLANYCHESYQKLSSDLESVIFQEEFKNHKKIFSLVKCKALYYSSMANYHQALVSVSSNMYSEIISFLGIALADCKECVRAAKEFESISTSFLQQFGLNSKNDEQDRPEARLMLLAENLLAAIASSNAQASKDNDLIYNAEIVPRQRLKIDKVLAVKAISFKEILVASQHPVGENFKTLISMKTHLTASRYSVKKDSILRLLKEEISQSDQILTVTLSSLNIQKFLSNFQQALENSKYVPNLPEVLIQAIKNCNEHEKNGETGAKMDSLISMIRVINHEIQQLMTQLKEEEIHSEENRARFLDKWRGTSSSKASAMLQQAIAQIILEVNQIDSKIKELRVKLNDISPLIAMWKNHLDTIHQQFQRECKPSIPIKFGDEISQIEALDLIAKIQDIVKRLQHIKKERGTILQEMQCLAKNDDITYAILSSAQNEESIIDAESIKYQQFDDRFAATSRLQSNLLSEIKNLVEHVQANSHYYKEFLVIQEKSKLVADKWSKISAYYLETRRDVDTMEGNLREINTRRLQLQTQVTNFVEQRQHEEKAILERISSNMAASPKANFNPFRTVYNETANFGANLPPPRSPYSNIEPMVRFEAATSPISPQYSLAEFPSQFPQVNNVASLQMINQPATQYNIPVTDFDITAPLRPPAPKPPTQFLSFLNLGQPNFVAQQARVNDSPWNQGPLSVHPSQFAGPQPGLQPQTYNLYPQPNPAQAESSHVNSIKKTNTSLLD